MLTGDREEQARPVAQRLKLDTLRADLLPEDKAGALEALGPVKNTIFVGDGINDAPVLATAGVGVAMSATAVAQASFSCGLRPCEEKCLPAAARVTEVNSATNALWLSVARGKASATKSEKIWRLSALISAVSGA